MAFGGGGIGGTIPGRGGLEAAFAVELALGRVDGAWLGAGLLAGEADALPAVSSFALGSGGTSPNGSGSTRSDRWSSSAR